MTIGRKRKDYDGEFVLTTTTLEDGRKKQIREWIPNAIDNQITSSRAAVIGSNSDSQLFDFRKLRTHRGGLMGKLRLQTYGTGKIWTEMPFDFFVCTNRFELAKLATTDYHKKTPVYTTARMCVQYPGYYYMVPFQPRVSQLALPIYLAAFDGHKEVFLLGYNKETAGKSRTSWANDVDSVFRAYPGTKFYLVGAKSNFFEQWKNHRNVTCMEYRKFITYCDV